MMNEKESKAFLNGPSWRPAEAETVDLWTACLLVAKSGVHPTYHNAFTIFAEAQVEINDGRDKRDKLSKAGFLVGKQDKDFPWKPDDFCKNPPKVNLRAFTRWANHGHRTRELEEAMEDFQRFIRDGWKVTKAATHLHNLMDQHMWEIKLTTAKKYISKACDGGKLDSRGKGYARRIAESSLNKWCQDFLEEYAERQDRKKRKNPKIEATSDVKAMLYGQTAKR